MNRASILMTLLTVMALAWPRAALSAPQMTFHEEAIEGGRLVSLKLNKDLNGVASVSRCAGCALVQLKVTPETQVIINGKASPLTSETKLIGKQADMFYVIKERRLARIRLY